MHRPRHLALSTLAGRLREETGSALIELAVVLSLLGIPLLLGVIYTGVLYSDYIQITNAAHTGALYAMRSATYAEDSTGITAAAQADASDIGTNLTVTPSIYYVCSNSQDGTQYTLQTDAAAACNGGSSHTLEFVQVTASAPITSPATFPGMPRSMTLTSTSAMEVEE
jgi:Flp pilus assembly protein TadG